MRTQSNLAANPGLSREGGLLFTLLDSIDAAGLMTGTYAELRWREIKSQAGENVFYEQEAEVYYSLMPELESKIGGTWMAERWQALQRRLYSSS